MLGIVFDSELKFKEHISKICNMVHKKINSLLRIADHMSLDKQKMLLKAFNKSHFSYCSLIWILHLRALNNKISHLREKALRIVYLDFKPLSVPIIHYQS